MRKLLSKTMIFIGVLSLMLGVLNSFGSSVIYAEDLELVGANLGLEIAPADIRLFDLSRLNPGDTEESKITIRNNYIYGFQLYMRTERTSPIPEEGEVDLFKQLKLTVHLDSTEIYSGNMIDYGTTNINLGKFNPSEVKELKATVHLPGPETGNEYQGKAVDVKWIFIAESDEPSVPEPPDPPDTPEPPDIPDTPDTPESPSIQTIPEEPDEIIDEEIPEDLPEEIIEEEIPQDVPDEIEEEEEIEEEIPEDVPRMPKTGEIPTSIFYGVGTLMLIIGIELGFKKKK